MIMVKDPVLQSAIQHCNGSQLSQVVYLYTPINSLPHISLDTYIGYRWYLKGKVEHKAIVISQILQEKNSWEIVQENCSNPLYPKSKIQTILMWAHTDVTRNCLNLNRQM